MPGDAVERLRQALAPYVLFHLGSDAKVVVRKVPEGVLVEIDHGRVHPIQWPMPPQEAERLLQEPDRFEDAILDQLKLHRRA